MWITIATATFAATASAALYPGLSTQNHTCAIQPAYRSCSPNASPSLVDTCCVETYGGLLLATQFWDTWADKPIPANTWTLHGLWPDFCNGSYTQYCDLNRQYDPYPSPNTTNGLPNGTVVPPYKGPNIGTFLEPFGKYDLLAWMNNYWIAQTGPNYDFWGHEFSKHATCYSTFDVPCYGPEYIQHEDVVDFFETAISYYLKFPTYQWLSKHGILPSNSTGYSKRAIVDALTQESGAVPYLGCSGPRYNDTAAGKAANTTDTGRTEVSEVWYFMHAYGRPQNGHTVPVDSTTISPCTNATNAVRYYQTTPQNVTRAGNYTY
ncbi:hypothetical protein DOTSEDRAFT_153940 [Dothistroma septosporum NZE10]|uniref:ribonuclease T2 n=1 Tax=Dothistroma septosporum (strain NZE10 / CBS 128990) TaxID=675120 RepID=M2XLW2_DOTSN|nr:hypothetical protein DOTSEDRAFT_153940 [Dothistroma septosporum NZE10]